MNDEERADWLARAIDDLLASSRQRPNEPPPELERSELNALLRVAEGRIESGQTRTQSGLQYEGEVWHGVLQKLDRRKRPRKTRSRERALPEEQLAADHRLEEMEIEELRNIARMRRELSEEAAQIAEKHRDDVWQRVVARLHDQTDEPPPRKKRSRFPFFWRKKDKSGPGPSAGPAGFADEPLPEDDSEVQGLMEIVRTRSYWSQITKNAAVQSEQRVWDRVSEAIVQQRKTRRSARPEVLVGRAEHSTPNKTSTWWPKLAFGAIVIGFVYLALGNRNRRGGRGGRKPPDRQTAVKAWWPRFAAAAFIAVALAALGPLPATGFDGHPIAVFGRSVAGEFGAGETAASPPIVGSAPGGVAGREVTIAEASDLLGAGVRVPPAPEGFTLVASRFFDPPPEVSKDHPEVSKDRAVRPADSDALLGEPVEAGGIYALTYAGPDGATLTVYQERAPASDASASTRPVVRPTSAAVPLGAAPIDVALEDGTAATYVEGAWQPGADGTLTWSPSPGRSLIFERAGLRTTLQYTGPESAAPSLFALAESLTPAG
jgi:hypothetical protein